MRMNFLVPAALLAVAVPNLWATTKGVKDIDIIVKKHPTGNGAIAVRTDGGGTARIFLAEAGEYDIEFSSRDAGPRILSVEGQLKKAIGKSGSSGFAAPRGSIRSADPETIGIGFMAVDTNPDRVRLKHPRIDLTQGIHTERITTFGPADLMLRLTEDVPDPARPGLKAPTKQLEFVAVEGGPAPARQTVPVLSDTGADWQIQFAPIDRISASFSKPGGRLAPGVSDTVDVTVLAVGLAPGVYKGQISILTAAGGQTGEPTFIPLYLRILPRTQILSPVLSRRTLVFPGGTETQSLELTNPNAVPQTYTIESADAAGARAMRLTPAQLVLQPGQSGRVAVSLAGALGPFTLRVTSPGQPATNVFVRGLPVATRACLPTELIPVLASVDPQIGADGTGTFEVWDNCGQLVRDAVVKVEGDAGSPSFLGINDGVSLIKVGLGKNPPGQSRAIAIVRDPILGDLTGTTGPFDPGGTPMPALADADKPFEIVEVVDAETGEPGTVAPGAQFTLTVITKSSSNIKNNLPARTKEHNGRSVQLGDLTLDIIAADDESVTVEVPADVGPQYTTAFQTTKSGIKTQPRSLSSAPAAPALRRRLRPLGNAPEAAMFKMIDGEPVDWTAVGAAPPKAGDVIQVEAIGLGATDADGNVLGTVKLLLGGVEAKIQSSVYSRVIWPPRFTITAEMPEIANLQGGPAEIPVKIVVGDIESAEEKTPPVELLQTTKVKLRIRPSNTSVIYKIDGTDYSGNQDFDIEKDTEVSFDAPANHFYNNVSQRFRSYFGDWGGSKANQFKSVISADTTMQLNYYDEFLHVLTGAVALAPGSPSGYYAYGASLTIAASCPQGQAVASVDWAYTTWSGNSKSGNIPAASLPLKGFIPQGPTDFKVNCTTAQATTVNLTVTTNPAGLGVRIGTSGNFTAGPVTQQVPANQAATIATQTPQILNGTGYTFTGWSTGGTGTTTTVTPTANTTATANFTLACYVLSTNSSGGTITANPPGSVTGFQTNCYAPGTVVTLTATPNPGNTFTGWSGAVTGSASPVTVTMSAPRTVTAGFSQPTVNACVLPSPSLALFEMESAANPISDTRGNLTNNQSVTLNGLINGYTAQSNVLTSVPGKTGKALSFPASPRSAILLGSHASLADSTRDITVITHVKIAPGERGGVVFGRMWNNQHAQGRYGGERAWHSFSIQPAAKALELDITDGNQGTSGNYPFGGSTGFGDDGAWHCIGFRIKSSPATVGGIVTTLPEVTMFADGQTVVITNLSTGGLLRTLSNLPQSPNSPTAFIGYNGLTQVQSPYFQGTLDDFQIFDRALTDGEMKALCGTCQTSSVTVDTFPAGIGATVGLTGVGSATNTFTTSAFTAGAATVNVLPVSILNAASDTRYDFKGWSFNNVPNPAWTSASQAVTLPATGGTYTAVFDTLYRVTTSATGGCTIVPASGFYAAGVQRIVTVTVPQGVQLDSLTAGAQQIPNNSIVVINAPANIVATCSPQQQQVAVTVNTAPANIGVTVGIGAASSPNSHAASLPGGSAQTLTAAPQAVVFNNQTYYQFQNWTPAGPAVTLPATGAATYTANYTATGYVVTATGCGVTVGPSNSALLASPLVYPAGASLTVTANPPTGQQFQNFQVLIGANATTVTNNPATITLSGPAIITANCGAPTNVTVTLTSNPVGLGVRFGASGNFTPGPISQQFPASNNTQTIATQTPQVLNGTGYAFVNWSTGGSTPVTTIGTAFTFTATANFQAACHILTVSASGGTVALNPATGLAGFPANCYAPGTVVTLTASPNTGNQFTGWSGDATGSTSPVTVTMNGPKSVNAAFGAPQNVTLTVASNPAGLGVRIGASGAFTADPVSQQVPAGSTQTIAADTPQVVNGTGYRFTGWSTGANTAVATVQPNANLTATAIFQTACHTVTLTGVGSGTVALNPAQGNAPGFPNNCFVPGSQVRLLATANTGFGVRDVVINNGGVPSTVTTVNTLITVNGPVVATATFIPRPGTVSTIFPPVLVSGTTYRSNIFFSNPTPTAGFNLRIMNVSFNPTGGTGSPTLLTALPLVLGSLPANGQSSTQQLDFTLPATLTAYNIFVTVEVQNSNGDTFTNVVSVGHTKP